jgi:hypothetical protein
MDEAQYDIPWELKARAIHALRARPHSANDPGTSINGINGGLIKLPSSKFSPPERQNNSTSTSNSTPSPCHDLPQHQRVRSACVLPNNQTQQQYKNSNYPQVQIGEEKKEKFDPFFGQKNGMVNFLTFSVFED